MRSKTLLFVFGLFLHTACTLSMHSGLDAETLKRYKKELALESKRWAQKRALAEQARQQRETTMLARWLAQRFKNATQVSCGYEDAWGENPELFLGVY